MDFNDLVDSVIAEEQEPITVKADNKDEITINEEKLNKLRNIIDSETSHMDLSKKGCFGKLVRLSDSPICAKCSHSEECRTELLEKGPAQMAEAEAELEAIVGENELDGELAAIGKESHTDDEIANHPLLKKIYNSAEKGIKEANSTEEEQKSKPMAERKPEKPESKSEAEPEQHTEDNMPITPPESVSAIDISDLGKRARVKFDFNAAKDQILTEKPTDFKRVRKICLGLVGDTYKYGSTAYANANKIMKKLQEIGVCGWDAKAKQITYNV